MGNERHASANRRSRSRPAQCPGALQAGIVKGPMNCCDISMNPFPATRNPEASRGVLRRPAGADLCRLRQWGGFLRTIVIGSAPRFGVKKGGLDFPEVRLSREACCGGRLRGPTRTSRSVLTVSPPCQPSFNSVHGTRFGDAAAPHGCTTRLPAGTWPAATPGARLKPPWMRHCAL